LKGIPAHSVIVLCVMRNRTVINKRYEQGAPPYSEDQNFLHWIAISDL
jgi:hypothetical protein